VAGASAATGAIPRRAYCGPSCVFVDLSFCGFMASLLFAAGRNGYKPIDVR
jgi:hypothetical protein